MTTLKLLAVDSSAVSAGAAVFDGDKLLSESFVNAGLTHSRTLMPMVNGALGNAGLTIEDIDAFAVSRGPGSFTGVRIGVAAVKGLAFPGDKPCAGVSTLEAMAYNFTDEDCTVCTLMDARRSQVYTALFSVSGVRVTRLSEDGAKSIEDVASEISGISGKIYLCGDGSKLHCETLKAANPAVILPAENRRYQRAYGVGLAAIANGGFASSALLEPAYVRPSQAERELRIKKEGIK